MATRIQHRRGTAAEWASVNPVLAAGEPGYETDTGQVKTGDGTTQWSQLPNNVRRTNTWQDATTTNEVELDIGDGLKTRIPLGDVGEAINSVTAKQPTKCVRLESGAWVWDTTAGTHYVMPDHTGVPVIRAKPWPTPASTPALDW